MAEQTVLFLHGFSSSAQCVKARYFGEKFADLPEVTYHAVEFNPTPTDFFYMTTTGLVDRLRQYILDHQLENVHFIGSSYGGLVAVLYAHRFGGIARMLLLAPGLRWLSGGLSEPELAYWEQAGVVRIPHLAFEEELPIRYDLQRDGLAYLDVVPPAAPATIIHGYRDSAVPIEDSRAYAADYADQVHLIEVDATHDLNGHLELVWEQVQSFLLAP
jgi:pimeloyl-ACP methyl ester carboxylesterase